MFCWILRRRESVSSAVADIEVLLGAEGAGGSFRMGIHQFWPSFAEASIKRVDISKLRGQTVAVDASSWLHKGCARPCCAGRPTYLILASRSGYACVAQLAMGIPCDAYVKFCLKRIEVLRHKGVRVGGCCGC